MGDGCLALSLFPKINKKVFEKLNQNCELPDSSPFTTKLILVLMLTGCGGGADA